MQLKLASGGSHARKEHRGYFSTPGEIVREQIRTRTSRLVHWESGCARVLYSERSQAVARSLSSSKDLDRVMGSLYYTFELFRRWLGMAG